MKQVQTMSSARRATWTRRLVLVGIVLGYLSYGTDKLGIGEIYPFADWRLYSAPIGVNEPYTTYRIYINNEGQETWRRVERRPTAAFTRKERSYVIGYWSRQALKNPSSDRVHGALRVLAMHLAPEADQYRVVAETFFALPLLEDTTRYDTSTVAVFNR